MHGKPHGSSPRASHAGELSGDKGPARRRIPRRAAGAPDDRPKDFAGFAARVDRDGTADDTVVNPENGNRRTVGGVIAHLITHSMHHRAQILYMLETLGVADVIEGDALGWESVARGWGWPDGGSYGMPAAERL